jgi:long-subunit acyl-CoA synthetase (AMP-forming)
MYLHAEGKGSHRVVTREFDGVSWRETPGWRFFRQVLRAGLYLRERALLRRGDCVVTLSRLRTERLVAEWAAIAQGAAVATLEPQLSDLALAAALDHLAPRIVFAGSSDERQRVLDLAGANRAFDVIVFDGLVAVEGRSCPWSAVCDLGGTLDTAERAQALRSEMRAVKPEEIALVYRQRGANEDISWKRATHAEVVKQMIGLWQRSPAKPGDVAYVVEPPLAMGIRLSLWALVADGVTSIAIGTPGREAAELRAIRPHLAVLPYDVGLAAMKHARPTLPPQSGARLEGLPVLRVLARRAGRAVRDERGLREILALDGTPLR